MKETKMSKQRAVNVPTSVSFLYAEWGVGARKILSSMTAKTDSEARTAMVTSIFATAVV